MYNINKDAFTKPRSVARDDWLTNKNVRFSLEIKPLKYLIRIKQKRSFENTPFNENT